MNLNKSKLVALITGFISVSICILYLLLITIFDFRSFLNEHIPILSENISAVYVVNDYLH